MRATRRRLPLLLALALAPTSCGAGDEPPPASEAPGTVAQPIQGGYSDADDTGVVGIYWTTTGSTCTGSLIAPNLVLTARHCVAPLGEQEIACPIPFGPTAAASEIYVTVDLVLGADPSAYVVAAEVHTPPNSNDVCGGDIALIVLAEPYAAAESTPLVPRIDLEVSVGEEYSAIGYGGTDDQGAGAGERRRRDGLFVTCTGVCPQGDSAETEWVGDFGICVGDSGGPAIDADGRVVGVVSRGQVGCLNPVYGAVTPWSAWLVEVANAAAEVGGYRPPGWAAGGSADAGVPDGGEPQPDGGPPGSGGGTSSSGGSLDPKGDEVESSSGCDVSGGGPGSGGRIGWLLLTVVGLSTMRRRSKRVPPAADPRSRAVARRPA